MTKRRVVIVVDAVSTRRLVLDVLEREHAIDVAGVVPSVRLAVSMIPDVQPDVLVVDDQVVDADGLAGLHEIRRVHARLPILLLVEPGDHAAGAAPAGLAAAASDYVVKPAATAAPALAHDRLAAELLPRIRGNWRCERAQPARAAPMHVAPPAAVAARLPPVTFVCIGASTGGPNALDELFSGFLRPLPVPVAIVQHMPARFTAMLAERLDNGAGAMRCREACDGELFEPGVALLAPGGFHLGVTRGSGGRLVAHLRDTPAENSCRPAADVLFREAAAAAGAGVLAVVMTGMGHDGGRGAASIRGSGGHVVVQDEATSVVWGMPGTVVEAGLASAVVPLSHLAAEITRRVFASPRV